MCRPPDVPPQLPSNTPPSNALPANRTHQPSSWATQQEQWNSIDQTLPSWDWYDAGTIPQGRQNALGRVPPVATLGVPVAAPSMDDKFPNYSFVDPSGPPHAFGQAPNPSWNGSLKFPLQPTHLWQESPLAKWSSALNPSAKPDAGRLPNLAQWVDPSFTHEESMDKDLLDEPPAVRNKKIKRMLSNRASAKRSRQRRQERLDELEIQSAKLHVEHSSMSRKLREALEASRRHQDENSRLKREIQLLKSHLELRNSKRLKDSSNDIESDEPPFDSSKSAASSKSETLTHSPQPSRSDDPRSDEEEVKQEPHGAPFGKDDYSSSPFSPESGVTATPPNTEALPVDLSFPMQNPDVMGNQLPNLEEDDWFADLADCFDEKPFLS